MPKQINNFIIFTVLIFPLSILLKGVLFLFSKIELKKITKNNQLQMKQRLSHKTVICLTVALFFILLVALIVGAYFLCDLFMPAYATTIVIITISSFNLNVSFIHFIIFIYVDRTILPYPCNIKNHVNHIISRIIKYPQI